MTQAVNPALYGQQRSFLAGLQGTDKRISIHLGRIEQRTSKNLAATDLRGYLASLKVKIDPTVCSALMDIAKRHSDAIVFVEKAVDVMIAIDLVTMAINNAYDAAYLLSADGDYTPAVAAARALGKRELGAPASFVTSEDFFAEAAFSRAAVRVFANEPDISIDLPLTGRQATACPGSGNA